MLKGLVAAAVLAASLTTVGQAEAKGCIKGALVGGIAGHFAGHHGMMGAAAGCAVGHHYANKQKPAPSAGGTDTPSQTPPAQ